MGGSNAREKWSRIRSGAWSLVTCFLISGCCYPSPRLLSRAIFTSEGGVPCWRYFNVSCFLLFVVMGFCVPLTGSDRCLNNACFFYIDGLMPSVFLVSLARFAQNPWFMAYGDSLIFLIEFRRPLVLIHAMPQYLGEAAFFSLPLSLVFRNFSFS